MAEVRFVPVFVDFEYPAVMRAMILHILEHAHIEECDEFGRPIMTFSFPVEDLMIDRLAAFGSRFEDLEPEPLEADEVDSDPISG